MSGGNSKIVASLVVGMVLGVAAAGGVAWYLAEKRPKFANAEQAAKPAVPAPVVASAPAATQMPVVSAPVAASSVGETKQHFEFYHVLTDKPDNSMQRKPAQNRQQPPRETKPVPQQQHVASAPVATKDMYYVQAGSFPNEGDAEKLKAKLALSGFEASIQKADIPGKGEWHRVRLGPYNSADAGKTIAALKQNGVSATQMHAQ